MDRKQSVSLFAHQTWHGPLRPVRILLCALLALGVFVGGWMVGPSGMDEHAALAADEPFPLYMPIVLNGAGDLRTAAYYQVAYVNSSGAWLSSLDGRYVTLLTTDVHFGVEEDILVVQASPDGAYIAIQQTSGWAIYRRDGTLLADRIGPGFALTWDSAAGDAPPEDVLLSQIGHGIDRYTLATRQTAPLVVTSDDTNDHDSTWDQAGARLVFAHQEFGTKLYVTLVDPFDRALLPITGENRAAGKVNDDLVVVETVDSWHDQPLAFHWSTDGKFLAFAAKSTIYVVDMATKDALTLTPTGLGERFSGRAIDMVNDQILYFAHGGIYVTRLDGSATRQIVAGDDLHFPQWTHDGQQILYRGTDDRLYRVDADGSNNAGIPHANDVVQFVPL